VLTEQERGELDKAMTHYLSRRSGAITAMKILQRHRRWLSDESLSDLGEYLCVSTDELDSIATFYNLLFRRPAGRHVILVCDSMVCWSLGYEEIIGHLEERLGIKRGETTPDGRFTLLPIVCLGACEKAPAILVDDDLHGPVELDALDGILEEYR
jgi:NADH-quinone oxidoreductase subunit E